MTDFTTEDLLAELQQYHQPIPDRRPGGVTRKEFEVSQNISDKKAADVLDELVEQGVLVRVFARLGPNSQGFVYYKKSNSSDGD